MQIHIGTLIKTRAKLLRVGPTELGAKIETSKQNVYGIFRRQSIDSELLYRISVALEHNFFADLSDVTVKAIAELPAGQEGSLPVILKGREEDLERENGYLRRLNGLLEEQLLACTSNKSIV